MANKYRGEAELAGPNGETLLLRVGSQVICKSEVALAKPLGMILDDLYGDGFRLTTAMTMLRLALVRRETLSEPEAYQLIDDIGAKAVGDALRKAIRGSLGSADEPAKEGSENPPDTASA
jgi:hypothetical protein